MGSSDHQVFRAGCRVPRPEATETWKQQIAQTHRTLDDAMARVSALAPYAEVDALRDRLTADYGLDPMVVRDVVFRNLRGWVDDVARALGVSVASVAFEHELLRVWSQRLPTVHPPPLPRPFLPSPDWTSSLAAICGAVVGPAATGKTTSGTQGLAALIARSRRAPPRALGATLPVRRSRLPHRFTEASPTSKRVQRSAKLNSEALYAFIMRSRSAMGCAARTHHLLDGSLITWKLGAVDLRDSISWSATPVRPLSHWLEQVHPGLELPLPPAQLRHRPQLPICDPLRQLRSRNIHRRDDQR